MLPSAHRGVRVAPRTLEAREDQRRCREQYPVGELSGAIGENERRAAALVIRSDRFRSDDDAVRALEIRDIAMLFATINGR
jgi:hypothetical protein